MLSKDQEANIMMLWLKLDNVYILAMAKSTWTPGYTLHVAVEHLIPKPWALCATLTGSRLSKRFWYYLWEKIFSILKNTLWLWPLRHHTK